MTGLFKQHSYLLIIHFLSFRQNYYIILIFAEVSRKLQNQLRNVNLCT